MSKFSGIIPFYKKKLIFIDNKKSKLIFPKGKVKKNEKIEDAAKREALEECGIKGIFFNKKFIIIKKKKEKKISITFFLMKITKFKKNYKEKNKRIRKKIKIKKALKLDIVPDYIKKLIKKSKKYIKKFNK